MISHAVQPADLYGDRERESLAERRGELRAFVQALNRQKLFILSLFILLCAISAAVVLLIPGRYKSEAIVLVQPVGNLADPTPMNAQAPPEIVRSQLEVVQSPRVIGHVVEQLGLMDDPEFSKGASSDGGTDVRKASVIANVTKRLKVDNDGRSVTLHISFEANSPQKAEKITDEITTQYIRTASELKNRAVKVTQDRLEGRLADLRLDTLQAEQKAENYRRSAGLVWLSPESDNSGNAVGTTYNSRLLDQFSRQAADISAAAEQAKAKAREASGDMMRTGGTSTPEILSSAIVTSLLQRDAELAETEASMKSRYTPRYAPLLRIRLQRAKLHDTLNAARNDIKRSLNIQADSAEAANQAALNRASALEHIVDKQIADGARYHQLQRDAATKRKAYENFADQSNAISQRSLLQLPDAVLVSPASLPIKESWPNRIIFIVIGCVVSLVLSSAAAIVRELRSSAREETWETWPS